MISPSEERLERAALVELDAVVSAARGVESPESEPAPASPSQASMWPVVLALATTLVLWASAFTGIRYAVREYDALGLALTRNTVTALAMLAVALAWKREAFARLTAGEWFRLAVAGVVGIATYQGALILGERSVDAGTASLIINTSPIFTALLALVLLREHLGIRGWLGVLMGFAGATLLVSGKHAGARVEAGALFVLVAAVAQAVSFIIQKPLLAKFGPFTVTAWVAVFGALSLLPWTAQAAHALSTASAPATLAVLYLGLFPAAIGNLTWAYALSRLPAGRAAAALYLGGPIAMLISWLLLGEQPALLAMVGGGVVIASVALVNMRGRD
ncbi:MAG TPA: EamA family transporter [Gammaproteobacteria bacterium]|jgi:drug/metabolite transporter (DMT)-like permease|nr:EamA family transporter [Gammaproteobacteria bacterium]